MEYASIGKGNAALTTGIIGTAGVGLGLLGNLLGVGNGCACPSAHSTNHYEQELGLQLSAERSRSALLEATIYNDQKSLELYRYIDGKLDAINAKLCSQEVFNAQLAGGLGSVARTLGGLTKTVIPIDTICPDVMRRYNTWVAPTATAEDTTAAG